MNPIRAGFVNVGPNAFVGEGAPPSNSGNCGVGIPGICDNVQKQCLTPINIPATAVAGGAQAQINVVPSGGKCAGIAMQLFIAAASWEIQAATISVRNWIGGGPILGDTYISGATRDPLPFLTGTFDRNDPLVFLVQNTTGGQLTFRGTLWCNAEF